MRIGCFKGLLLLAALVLLEACADSKYPKVYFPPTISRTQQCQQSGANGLIADFTLNELCRRHTERSIGLALSGGGSKSAPFALGVLAGLQAVGILDHVEVISSVSGGSYAALYFYSRAMARFVGSGDALEQPDQLFWDCLPERYAPLFRPGQAPAPWSAVHRTGSCPPSLPPRLIGGYWPLEGSADDKDPLRQASHLRGYQDLLNTSWCYGNDVGAAREKLGIAGGVASIVSINSLLLGIPNYIANSIFDWRISLSWSRDQYASGISRTYSRDASSMAGSEQVRGDGDAESIARVTFPNLQQLYEYSWSDECQKSQQRHDCHLPFWVINATVGRSGSNLRLVNYTQHTAAGNGFEFTPYGYGTFGYAWQVWNTRELEPRLTVPEAVGTSAAFLDSQQSQFGGVFRPAVNLLLHSANLDWGTDIPNYQLTREQYSHRRLLHNFLIWPLYLFHYSAPNQHALHIHLSDGGQSENLGLYALLRRNLTDIIVVDGGEDQNYQLGDLCGLNNDQLPQNQVLILDLPGWDPNHCPTGYDPFHLRRRIPAPVLRGRVCDITRPVCNDETAIARLYIIKAAVNLHAQPREGTSLSDAVDAARAGQLNHSQCESDTRADLGYPCEVVGFLAARPSRNWPQDSTVAVTLNSNAYIFGAYRELGRYYGTHLALEGDATTATLRVINTWGCPSTGNCPSALTNR